MYFDKNFALLDFLFGLSHCTFYSDIVQYAEE